MGHRYRYMGCGVAYTLAGLLCVVAAKAHAAEVPVANSDELLAAISGATPGDEILLAPGVYNLGSKVSCNTAGTEDEPIIVRSATPLAAEIKFDTVEEIESNIDWNVPVASRPNCENWPLNPAPKPGMLTLLME